MNYTVILAGDGEGNDNTGAKWYCVKIKKGRHHKRVRVGGRWKRRKREAARKRVRDRVRERLQ